MFGHRVTFAAFALTVLLSQVSAWQAPYFPPIKEDPEVPSNLPEPDFRICDSEGKCGQTYFFRNDSVEAPLDNDVDASLSAADEEQPRPSTTTPPPSPPPTTPTLPPTTTISPIELMQRKMEAMMAQMVALQTPSTTTADPIAALKAALLGGDSARNQDNSEAARLARLSAGDPVVAQMLAMLRSNSQNSQNSNGMGSGNGMSQKDQQMMQMIRMMMGQQNSNSMMSQQNSPMMMTGMGMNGMASRGAMSPMAMNGMPNNQMPMSNPMAMNRMSNNQMGMVNNPMSMNGIPSNQMRMSNNPMAMNGMSTNQNSMMMKPMSSMNGMIGMTQPQITNPMAYISPAGQAPPPGLAAAQPHMAAVGPFPPPEVAVPPELKPGEEIEQITQEETGPGAPGAEQAMDGTEQPAEAGEAGGLGGSGGDQGVPEEPELAPDESVTQSPADYEAEAFNAKLKEVGDGSEDRTPAPSLESSEFLEQILAHEKLERKKPRRWRKPHLLVKASIRKLSKEKLRKAKWLKEPPPEFCTQPIIVHDECEVDKRKKPERRWSYNLEDGTCYLYEDPCPGEKKNSFGQLSQCIASCWRQIPDD